MTDQRHRRIRVGGKFLLVDGEKRYLRGVTYGTFAPEPDEARLPPPARVREDFAAMRAAGVNTVRVYGAPPRWFLDLALEHDLLVFVGLAWEQHVAFLERRGASREIAQRVAADAASCAGHPAVLCYAVGNEIPAPIVRWHGRRRVERFLRRLCRAVKEADPNGLVTYVNYPTTEYLDLPFLDIVSFNVFLESPEQFDAYVARLQNLAGDRPLLITEVGLDSRRNGLERQAFVLEDELRSAFANGCAGAYAFSWTDEWHRGDDHVLDWDFGLVDRGRRPKPALAAVGRAYADAPLPRTEVPGISVVVCTHNGAETLPECLSGLAALDYPAYEVIVVDDGSTDTSAEIAAAAGVRLIRTENNGLSSARNVGLAAASHDLVAFIDDDATPDRDWLRFLAQSFATSDCVGVGGPNVPLPNRGFVETAVARAPGGPIHVLLGDRVAEHIPGCNMAFRREALDRIGGFDPQFRVAGDDVDVCWRLQEAGGTLAFNPGAMVWHHRRRSVLTYLRQQSQYGKAEALLERKWPEKYNSYGHVEWAGQVYGAPRTSRRSRIYYGMWGGSLFQSLYHRVPHGHGPLPLRPEWYLAIVALVLLAIQGALPDTPFHSPATLALLAAALLTLAAWAVRAATRSSAAALALGRRELALRVLTGALFLLQPLVRLWGRSRHGLTPWRRRGEPTFAAPWPQTRTTWSERWHAHDERLRALERLLRRRCQTLTPGGEHDRWDLQVRLGGFGGARLRLAVEEYGRGRQAIRIRVWPVWTKRVPALILVAGALVAFAATRDLVITELAVALLVLLVFRSLREASAGVALLLEHAGAPPSSARSEDGRAVPQPPAVVRALPDSSLAEAEPAELAAFTRAVGTP